MRTPLDDSGDWLFEGATYDEELRVFLVEGVEDEVPDEELVGGTPVDTHPLVVSDSSRRFEVRFTRPIAWQCSDAEVAQEDLTARPDDEGVVQLLTGSRYLAYHDAEGLETELGPLRHYRIRTEDELVDVLCDAPPEILPSSLEEREG